MIVIALVSLSGCHDADFEEAMAQPIGADRNRPLLGAWEGDGTGQGGSRPVRVILFDRVYGPCACRLGPHDYWVYLETRVLAPWPGCDFVLRQTGHSDRAFLEGRALAPGSDRVYNVAATAEGDSITLRYQDEAKSTVYLVHLHRATRTSSSR